MRHSCLLTHSYSSFMPNTDAHNTTQAPFPSTLPPLPGPLPFHAPSPSTPPPLPHPLPFHSPFPPMPRASSLLR
ncbi:unnamed protein product [Closterium sp. NIES-54]